MSAWIWIKKLFPQDQPETMAAGMSRRSFIQGVVGSGAGVAASVVAPSLKIFLPPQKAFKPLFRESLWDDGTSNTMLWRPTTHTGNALSFAYGYPFSGIPGP